MRVLSLIAMLSATFAAQAQVYQCTDAEGRRLYQDRPCAAGQQTTRFDPLAGNLTTIDSTASREQTQGALLMREEIREQHIGVTTPAAADTRITLSEPAWEAQPVYPAAFPYPIYRDRHRDRDRGRDRNRRDPDFRGDRGDRDHLRPDTARARAGGGYVPAPLTIRQIAPRPPATSPAGSSRAGVGRDDDH